MTTSTIHPIVLEKLQRFGRHRRRLLLWRGLCSTLAIWLGTMIALALVDRLVVLPDGLRMGLSIAGYIATAILFWIECGRQLLHPPDVRELARLMELAAPHLHEELLSAVELAESDARWDSPEFRDALQQAAARDVGALQIDNLLPARLISRWLYAALALGTVGLVLLAIPGLRFTQSFARAALPGANLARYSSVQITVRAPTPPDQIVPEGDSVPVIVSLAGPEVQEVILETIPHHGPRERTPMSLSAVNEFTAAVQLNQQPVQFRIRARDAITRLYTLTPRPRPHIVRFHKTYQYPSYARLPVITVTEDDGDLDALAGTTVELNLEVDQPIKEAALQLEIGTGPTTRQEIPLARDASGRLLGLIPLTAAGIYQIRLVAAPTGFENKYSPQYEIRVRPDLLPIVKLDRPERDQVLPADSVVNLTGSATDDLALAHVDQLIQVNRAAWQTVLLATGASNELKVARTWDLFELGIQPGDQILTKLVATDLKGQRGESAPVRIRIARPGFDPERRAALKQQQALNQSIQEFRAAVESLDTKTREARAITADPLQRKQAVLAAATAAEAAARSADDTLRQLQETLPQTANQRDSADLALLGAAISRAQHDGIAPVQAALATTNGLEKILEPLNTGTALARAAADTHRDLLAAAEARLAARDLQQLAAEPRPATPDVERAIHRQTGTAAEVKAIQEELKTLAAHAGGNPANTARHHERELDRAREALEKSLTTEPTLEKLKPPADQLQRSLESAAAALQNASRELDQRAEAARNNLQQATGTAADAVARPSATEQLKDRAALEERRPHADPQFVAVLDKAAAAAQDTNNVKVVEQALRKLEAGHALHEPLVALQQLAAQERWEKPVVPEDWQPIQQQLQALPAQLQRAQLPPEAQRTLAEAGQRPAAQQINAELARRPAQPPQNIAEPLAKFAADVAQAQQQLQPALDQARAEIEKRAPTLGDQLAALATTAEQMQRDSLAQAQQPDPTALHAAARAQQRLDNRLEDVKDALRREANAQDLNTEDGRDRARDADNAVAMLRQKPAPTSHELLQQAATATQTEQQQKMLKNVAEQQGQQADDLKMLAEHFQNATAASRSALREAEKELGLKPTLDAEYAKARELERLAALTPEQQLAELEKTLPNSKPMQRELSDITKDTLRSAAKDLQQSAEKNGSLVNNRSINQAKRLAEQAQKLARQDVPAITQQAGQTAKTELTAAGQKLATAAQNLPQDATKPAEQIAKALSDQVAPLQQAADYLAKAADKLPEPAQAQARQAAQQAAQLAQQADQLAKGQPVAPSAPTVEQAKQLAAAAQKLAREDIPALAQKAGPESKPDLTEACKKLESVAQNTPQDFAKPPGELASQMQAQVAPLEQAAKDLNIAATKAGAEQQKANAAAQQAQAAHQQAQQAAKQTAQLAQQADQLAKGEPLTPGSPAAEQAKQLAAAAQKLARQDLPALAQKAGPVVEPVLTEAGQKLDGVAQSLPQDFSQPPEELAAQMQAQVAPLQQAAKDLSAVATQLGQAAQSAQQTANAAAQQAQAVQQQTRQAAQQTGQLAQSARQMAAALNQAQSFAQAAAQQPAVEQVVREAGDDIGRAGRHEARLGQTEAGQQLQQLGRQLAQESSAAIAKAGLAMAQANSPAQVQQAAQAAQAAIQSPLDKVNAAFNSPAGTPASSTETPNPLGALPDEAAQWLARSLDNLDSATQGQSAPSAASQALQAAAQTQAGQMMATRTQGLVPGEQNVAGLPRAGGGNIAPVNAIQPLPEVRPAGGNWGKLPPKLAKDLLDSQREGVSGEYREMVEMYFRAIADQAQEKQP